MTKLPTTREEYAALTDDERAEVDVYARDTIARINAVMAGFIAQVQGIANLITAWYANLPLDVRAELERLAESQADDEARSA